MKGKLAIEFYVFRHANGNLFLLYDRFPEIQRHIIELIECGQGVVCAPDDIFSPEPCLGILGEMSAEEKTWHKQEEDALECFRSGIRRQDGFVTFPRRFHEARNYPFVIAIQVHAGGRPGVAFDSIELAIRFDKVERHLSVKGILFSKIPQKPRQRVICIRFKGYTGPALVRKDIAIGRIAPQHSAMENGIEANGGAGYERLQDDPSPRPGFEFLELPAFEPIARDVARESGKFHF